MSNPIQKLMGLLPARIDCAIIQSDVNRRYFTGMLSSAGTVVCFREVSYLIIDFRYIEKARQCVTNCRVIEQHDLMFQIQELLRKHGAKTAHCKRQRKKRCRMRLIANRISLCFSVRWKNRCSWIGATC